MKDNTVNKQKEGIKIKVINVSYYKYEFKSNELLLNENLNRSVANSSPYCLSIRYKLYAKPSN
jgi:hypothetical protein